MGMWAQRISARMKGVWVDMGRMWGIRVAMQGIKVEN